MPEPPPSSLQLITPHVRVFARNNWLPYFFMTTEGRRGGGGGSGTVPHPFIPLRAEMGEFA